MSAASTPVVVVTGAASGIGAATARLFAERGWRTAGLDLRPSATDVHLTCDVADAAAVSSAIET
ncbi:MAG: SDR family NAD(P)-dependent oxidoreductase, partial [Nocardiopsaceae bacterium]|nr:SDR family NAD(P)-dependent oxidoreductase [Nocardiopsaceae bacterium]